MKNLAILVFISFCTSCTAQSKQETTKEKLPDLLNTKWVWDLGNNCINYFIFLDKYYVEYNCELGEEWQGDYEIKKDTLLLKDKIYTSNIPNQGKSVTNEYKMILTDKGLCIVYYKVYEEGKWDEAWIKSPNIFFKKVE